MKIIIAVASYYPEKNGVQAVTQYQAESLVKRGHEVIVVTKLVTGNPNLEVHKGVKIIRTNIYNKFTLHFGNKNEYRKTILNLTNDADILIGVCLQSVSVDWLLGILDDIKCRKILYMHGMHDFKWYKHDFNTIQNFLKKVLRNIRWRSFYHFYFKNIRKFDIVAHLHKQDISYRYFKKHKLGKSMIIQNCANEEFFKEKKININDLPTNYMICVSNYNPRKNQSMIMKAFYEANTEDYSLIFIGSNKNKYYEKLVFLKNKLEKKYGNKDVRIYTEIPREQVSGYIGNAKAYIMGSTWEAFPISIIEAMASAIPFISTDVGIIKFLYGGVIVKNKSEMSIWIENFIKNPILAKNIGNLGHLYASSNFKEDIQMDKFEKYIIDIALKRNRK